MKWLFKRFSERHRTRKMALPFILIAVVSVLLLCSPSAHAKKTPPLPADFNKVETAAFGPKDIAPSKQLRVVAFNMHYGEYFDDIKAYLKKQMSFPGTVVFLLSEADRWHSRSGDGHPARELAEALGLNMAWGMEFVIYTDKTPEKQGASGNAILSNAPLKNPRLLRHTMAYDWKKYGAFTNEPTDGERLALSADVELDGATVRVVSAHLENRADGKNRQVEMKEIINDIGDATAVIGGDMNEEAGPMDADIAAAGIINAFDGDNTRTCGCNIEKGAPVCMLKLDWIYFRGLKMTGAAVDSPGGAKGTLMSDHAPVRAEFEVGDK